MIKKSILICICLLFASSTSWAQRIISLPFSGGYDEDAFIQIGMQYNYISQNLQLTLKDNWKQFPLDFDEDDIAFLGDLKSIQSKRGTGLSIGIPIDFQLSQHVHLNVNPSFTILNGHGVRYVSRDTALGSLVRKSKHVTQDLIGDNFNSLEIPIGLKFRSAEKSIPGKDVRYRGYLLGGVRLSKWVGLSKNYSDLLQQQSANQQYAEAIVLKPEYLSWEAGMGFDIYLSYFKVSPEIRFSQSVNNVLANNHTLSKDNKFMAPIDKALIRNVYFSLIFQ